MPEDIDQLIATLRGFDPARIKTVQLVVRTLASPTNAWRDESSDVVSQPFLELFGDVLKLNHSISRQSLSKDRFEFALEKVLTELGVNAQLAPKGNPGHDITVAGVPWSLKTQANRDLKADELWVSKWMELGKGQWSDKVEDLIGLRDQFLEHLKAYERVFTLRRLGARRKPIAYELVEIPKSVLLLASSGRFEMQHTSKQMPKPGYCHVYGDSGRLLFDLYFDGGSERKLQIKSLRKDVCVVHATWSFEPETLEPQLLS